MQKHAHATTTVESHAAAVAHLVTPAIEARLSRSISVTAAAGRVAAADIRSPVDLPLFRNSQMDGYAVRVADLAVTSSLPVAGVIPARPGAAVTLPVGMCMRIMTGAVVPTGADAVVPVEETSLDGAMVTIHSAVASGAFVRTAGSDVHAGAVLVRSGTRLAARHIAAIAAAGIAEVVVRDRVRVSVITTGAELVSPGANALPGQVFDANQSALVAAIGECDAEISVALRVVDDHDAFVAALAEATVDAQLIVTSGGISQGDFEVVRDVLEPLGARVGHVAMQPGGPQLLGEVRGVPVVSFPGNPVSTQVSFAVFLRPLLRAAAGLPPMQPTPVRSKDKISSVAGKRQFLRGMLDGETVEIIGGASSHLVATMARANVLVDIPAEITHVEPGDTVSVWPL